MNTYEDVKKFIELLRSIYILSWHYEYNDHKQRPFQSPDLSNPIVINNFLYNFITNSEVQSKFSGNWHEKGKQIVDLIFDNDFSEAANLIDYTTIFCREFCSRH